MNLGKYSYHAASTAPIVATRDGSIKVDGWNLGLVGTLPVNADFSLFAKAGLLSYKIDYHCEGTGISCSNPERSDKGTPAYYGIGVAWEFTDRWFARMGYEIFKEIGEAFNSTGTTGTTKDDITLVSVGLGYHF